MKTRTKFHKTSLTKTKNKTNIRKPGAKALAKLDFSSLKTNEKRAKYRLPINGIVIINELDGKKVYKVNIKNLSPGGLCCEIGESAPRLKSEVIIEFSGAIGKAGLGAVKCRVIWITPIQSHPQNNQLIGLEFSEGLTPTKIKKIADFVEALAKDKSY